MLSELEKFGLTKDELIRLVITKTHSSLSTLYYLLLDTIIRRRRSMAKKAVASPQSSMGGMYNMIKGGGGGGAGAGTTGSSSGGAGGGGGGGGAVVGANVQNSLNAVAAAATHSLAQRYKNMGMASAGALNVNGGNVSGALAQTGPAVPSPRTGGLQQQQGQQGPTYTHGGGEGVAGTDYSGPGSNDYNNISRPLSASGLRPASGQPQRPLSAYAIRR